MRNTKKKPPSAIALQPGIRMIPLRIEDDRIDRLDRLAKMRRLSRNALVCVIIDDYLEATP
jgi:thiamine monophosphate synthase